MLFICCCDFSKISLRPLVKRSRLTGYCWQKKISATLPISLFYYTTCCSGQLYLRDIDLSTRADLGLRLSMFCKIKSTSDYERLCSFFFQPVHQNSKTVFRRQIHARNQFASSSEFDSDRHCRNVLQLVFFFFLASDTLLH